MERLTRTHPVVDVATDPAADLAVELTVELTVEHLAPFGVVLHSVRPLDLRTLPVARLRQLVRAHRLVVLRGFKNFDRVGLSAYAESWGPLLVWDFGTVLDLEVHESPANYLFTDGAVPLHWDGAFAGRVPSFQLFQCPAAPPATSGGETLFSDTTRVWESMPPAVRDRWQVSITYATQKVAHYGGQVTAALVDRHPVTGATILRFAEPTTGLNPVAVSVCGATPAEERWLLESVRRALHDRRFCYVHSWRTGDLLLADNHALLHGRRAFLAVAPRHLQRVHIL